jgi:hypothetical protein
MSAERFSTWARWVSVAVLTAAWLGFAVAPASAQDTSAAKARESKAHTSSLSLNAPAAASAPAAAPANRGGSFLNGFVYATGPQSLGFRGRVNVGKTGVYVPYYGNVDTDPLHPNSQTSAGIGYGFRGRRRQRAGRRRRPALAVALVLGPLLDARAAPAHLCVCRMKPLPSESVPNPIQQTGVSSMWSDIATPRALSSATAARTSFTTNITPSDGRNDPLL